MTKTLKELMESLPNCEICGRKALGLLEGQPSHLCMGCFKGSIVKHEWLFSELKSRAPNITDEEHWALFTFITKKMCHCLGPKPCYEEHDEQN